MSEQNSCSMPMQVKIHGKSESATRINVSAGKFNLIIDEPEQMGGSNLGPTPVQVLLMALAEDPLVRCIKSEHDVNAVGTVINVEA